jgi:hypothetical protein
LLRTIEKRATGSAADARITKIEHAMISSISVIPASDLRRDGFRGIRLMIGSCDFSREGKGTRDGYCFT